MLARIDEYIEFIFKQVEGGQNGIVTREQYRQGLLQNDHIWEIFTYLNKEITSGSQNEGNQLLEEEKVVLDKLQGFSHALEDIILLLFQT